MDADVGMSLRNRWGEWVFGHAPTPAWITRRYLWSFKYVIPAGMALTAAWFALSSGRDYLLPIGLTGLGVGFAIGFAFFFSLLSIGVAGRVRESPGIPLRYLGAAALLAVAQLVLLVGVISPFGLGLLRASSGTWTAMGYAFGAASASAFIAALLATPRRGGSARTGA